MGEPNLTKLSLIISVTGIFLLLLLSQIIPPRYVNIEEISEKHVDKQIKVQGAIISERLIDEGSNFKILTIKDNTGQIEIALNSNITFKNKQVQVQGTISQYQDIFQIQAERIIEIS